MFITKFLLEEHLEQHHLKKNLHKEQQSLIQFLKHNHMLHLHQH